MPIEALQTEVKRLVEEMEYVKAFCHEKERLVHKLHDENKELKSDIIGKFREKLAMAVIEALDFADDKIADFDKDKKECSQEAYDKLCGLYRTLADDIREMLQNRLDMEYFKGEEGIGVDLKRHKVLKTHRTDDDSLHKTIKTAKRYGYEADGKVIRMALIEAYEFHASAPPVEVVETVVERSRNEGGTPP